MVVPATLGTWETKQHIRGEEGWIQHWANGVCWAYGKPVKSGPVHGSKMLVEVTAVDEDAQGELEETVEDRTLVNTIT